MMSNQPSSLQSQPTKQFHRRQNSTPVVAFEAMKVSQLPPQRQDVHRRGLSFDQHQRSPIRRQPGNMVSITNPPHGQHILREAQQLRTARPGQQHITTDLPISPNCANFPNSQPSTPYDQMSMNAAMQKSQSMQFQNSPYYPYDMSPAMSPMQNAFPNVVRVDENSQHYFQNVHPNQDPNMVFDRRMSQPDLRVQTMRPLTPADQIQNGRLSSGHV
jgi:hypothetical protein